jgi:tRNA U34 5-methylaminomethyl-2-thiouridine-forming methyltransferase MnmC
MPSVVVTADGSHTVATDRGVTYHSMHGAIAESSLVFIQHGLAHVATGQQHVAIFELGFGTGLNALLCYLFSVKHPEIRISYQCLEPFPLDIEIVDQLNYIQLLEAEAHLPVFKSMHVKTDFIRDNFSFLRVDADLQNVDIRPGQFDLVFYDAFGPGDQAELWDIAALRRMYSVMRPNGVLVTYCAQGQFKRNLKSLGFAVEALPGPPGKREVIRAIKA